MKIEAEKKDVRIVNRIVLGSGEEDGVVEIVVGRPEGESGQGRTGMGCGVIGDVWQARAWRQSERGRSRRGCCVLPFFRAPIFPPCHLPMIQSQ
jgi:hypothetical protein